jgi:hypothetical protein
MSADIVERSARHAERKAAGQAVLREYRQQPKGNIVNPLKSV